MTVVPGQAPIRVMIVEDSTVVRTMLEQVIAAGHNHQVVASVGSAEEGLEVLDEARPDVISLDIGLPGMNGFEFTRKVMQTRPTPIVVVSASFRVREVDFSIRALSAGALTIIEKPTAETAEDYEEFGAFLRTQLKIMSEIRVVRQRPLRQRETKATLAATAAHRTRPRDARQAAVGVVASTGGPNAVSELLRGLGPAFPAPVFLVQHMTASFMPGFVRWLDRVVPQPVVEGENGMRYEAGTVYVAPAGSHMRLVLSDRRISLDGESPENFQRPAGDALLRSLASAYASNAVGVVLTGMGRDGAAGLRAIRDAGGVTLAEHPDTCVIYGMPQIAERLGAVQESLPLGQIAPRLLEILRNRPRATP